MDASSLLNDFVAWAATRPDVLGAALVGSHARGKAKPSSDIDLVIVCAAPGDLLEGDWPSKFGTVERPSTEDFGALRALRVHYGNGMEVEFGLALPSWAGLPLDSGTQRVLADGARILHDPRGLLQAAMAEAGSSSIDTTLAMAPPR